MINSLYAQGLLPTRGSFVLDAVFLAMFAIAICLMVSIALVKRKRFSAHRKIQVCLSLILIVAILIFEFDIRFVTDWRAIASQSRYFESGWVDRTLWIHLFFAIPTPLVWAFVVILALRRFPNPPVPGQHSAQHKLWGWIATGMMMATAITGCIFYWTAFAM